MFFLYSSALPAALQHVWSISGTGVTPTCQQGCLLMCCVQTAGVQAVETAPEAEGEQVTGGWALCTVSMHLAPMHAHAHEHEHSQGSVVSADACIKSIVCAVIIAIVGTSSWPTPGIT